MSGLRPGMSRDEVLALLGPPAADGWDGQRPTAVPDIPLATAPVWIYRGSFLEVVVLFRGDLVSQLWGNALEWGDEVLLAPGTPLTADAWRAISARFQPPDGLYGRGVLLRPDLPAQVRLNPSLDADPAQHPGGTFLRERLATANGLPAWQIFPYARAGADLCALKPIRFDSRLVRLEQADYKCLITYSEAALQQALRDCLQAGSSYRTEWRGSEARNFVVDLPPGKNTAARCLALAKFMAGLEGSLQVVQEVADSECWPCLQRLRWMCADVAVVSQELELTFHPYYREYYLNKDGQLAWTPDFLPEGKFKLLEHGRPGELLRWLTALDRERTSLIIPRQRWDDRTVWRGPGQIHRIGRPTLVAEVPHDLNPGPDDGGEGLFLALLTPSDKPIRPRDTGYFRILEVLTRLRSIGRDWPDLSSLQSPLELHLLRRIEQFPYPYYCPRFPGRNRSQPARYYLRYLSFLARDALHFIPHCRQPAQRALALGLATVLENGMRAIGCRQPSQGKTRCGGAGGNAVE